MFLLDVTKLLESTQLLKCESREHPGRLTGLLPYRTDMNSTDADLPSLPGIAAFHDATVCMIAVSVNLVLSLPLNGYVMWLILRGVGGTLASDFFPLNLAVSEILFSLCSVFYVFHFTLKSLFCFEVFMFALGFVFTARPLVQGCISVECYVGVVHPVLYLQYKSLGYKVACSSVGSLFVLASCLYCKYTYANPIYLYGFFIQNVAFFFVMVFCCLAVARALQHPGPGETFSPRGKANKPKRKAFKRIVLILISLAFNFFFILTATPLQCCLSPENFTKALSICTCLALMSGFTQPLLYLYRNKTFICIRQLG